MKDDEIKLYKSDMVPPAPTNHIDPRMHLRLEDVWKDDGDKLCIGETENERTT